LATLGKGLGGAGAALLALCALGAFAADRSDQQVIGGNSKAGTARSGKALVYAALGPELRDYELDLDGATLEEKSSVTLPADIQAGYAHPSGRDIVIAWSDGTNVSAGTHHGLSLFRIDPMSAALSRRGEPEPLASRPIYVSADRSEQHVLVAYTSPTSITVHPSSPDGTLGPSMTQPPLNLGIYGHQILVDPTNTMAILVARGNVAAHSRTEDPGALDVLGYKNGVLRNRVAIAPNGGFGFHPRYLDFHPSRPWIFVSLSQQNAIGVYEKQKDGTLSASLFERNSLADPDHLRAGQLSGALHVHPNGKFVYLANRSTAASTVDGKPVFAGGENGIAVFKINKKTGEPSLIQNVDTRGIGPVEFAFDPNGHLLVVANMLRLWVSDAGSLRSIPPNLAIFRVRDDGKLEFVRKYDLESGDRTLFWMGVSSRP
jgi:6-phosphogluconolactonase